MALRWALGMGMVIGCAGDLDHPLEAQDSDPGTLHVDPCPEGFWGEDCALCSWESAGAACAPLEEADVFDMELIAALGLDELGWMQTNSTVAEGVEILEGTWSGGIFEAIDALGNPASIELRQAAALYIPIGTTAVQGLVVGAHHARLVVDDTPLSIAQAFDIPVLYHGESNEDWRDLGFDSRGELNGTSTANMHALNPCHLEEPTRGNFGYHLARTHLRAITLLQRVVPSVTTVALRGFSKEGTAVWLAAQYDDRIEVASPGGTKLASATVSLPSWWEDYGCDETTEQGLAGAETRRSWDWLTQTPAGASIVGASDVLANIRALRPRLVLMDGDQGAWDQHDGRFAMPPAADTPFLDAFTQRPWRYVRKSLRGPFGDDGDAVSRDLLPVLAAELLVDGPGSEAQYPKVSQATAALEGDRLTVQAQVAGPFDELLLWWGWSQDRVWHDRDQERWQSVPFEEGRAETVVPAGGVVAWYVEARFEAKRGDLTYVRRDASPIRMARQVLPESCEVELPDRCE